MTTNLSGTHPFSGRPAVAASPVARVLQTLTQRMVGERVIRPALDG